MCGVSFRAASFRGKAVFPAMGLGIRKGQGIRNETMGAKVMNQLVEVQNQALMAGNTPSVPAIHNDGFMALLEKVADSPNLNPDVLNKLIDAQERVMAKQAEIEFNQAMTRLMPKLPTITKKGKIEFTDKNGVKRETPFAKYEDIDEQIRPHLIAEGFSISFDTAWTDQGVTISGTLSHSAGHSRTSSMRLPLDTSGSKNNLQAMGSTISYGKRYLVGMLLNIVTKGEDDDGKGADDVIALEDAAEIDHLIKQSGADKQKFLEFFKIADVRELRARDKQKALNLLNAKTKKAAK